MLVNLYVLIFLYMYLKLPVPVRVTESRQQQDKCSWQVVQVKSTHLSQTLEQGKLARLQL
jgi:hypothetical protein